MKSTASKALRLLSILLLSAPAARAAPTTGFQPGDCFRYDLYKSFIHVGQATLTFDYAQLEPHGPELLHAVVIVKTQGITDKFFKVRDRFESWMDPHSGRPIFYRKKQREGKKKQQIVEVRFDWSAMTATYTNNGVVSEPLSITADTFDPLSLITKITQTAFVQAETRPQATTNGKKLLYFNATRKADEPLKIKAGKFNAQQIEFVSHGLHRLFKKSPDASIELWLSQDSPSIPLRMKSEVSFGSFCGELREATYQGKRIGN